MDDTRPEVRRMRIWMALSVALNLLLIGLIAGAMAGGRGPMAVGRGGDVGFGPLSEALTAADRRALRERFFEMAPDFREEREAARTDFSALAAGLRADPWDRAAAETILARQAERGIARLAEGRALMLDYIASLGPEARRAFADRIEAALRRPMWVRRD